MTGFKKCMSNHLLVECLKLVYIWDKSGLYDVLVDICEEHSICRVSILILHLNIDLKSYCTLYYSHT